LEFLCARFPLVSLSNGNADLDRVGLAPYSISSSLM
jgi:putative hydrolase of the HAD superfamily